MSSQIKLTKSRAETNTDSTGSANSTANRLITKWRSIYIIVAICFVEALKITMVQINAWPYLQDLDNSIKQEFFGVTKTISTLAMMASSFVTGWIVNRILDTKSAILFGIILNIANCTFYANIAIFGLTARRWAYLLSEMCFGISGGAIMTWRAYIPMASIPEDRQRAFGLTNVAINSGLIISPFIVVPFGKLFANSFNLPWGSNLSIFTAPVYINAFLNLFLAFLVVRFYDGRFQVPSKNAPGEENGIEEKRWRRSDSIVKLAKNDGNQENGQIAQMVKEDNSSTTNSDFLPANRPDWIAVICCFLVRFSVVTYYIYLFSLASSFTMATFGWDGKEAMTYTTITQGLLGTMGLLISIGFSTHVLSRLAPERFFVLFSLAMMLLFYLLTFPWPFLSAKMPNCDSSAFSWCESTPAINVYVYNIALVGCLGLSLPVVFQNLDVLYSRLLGPIKQGVLQAAFHGVGEATSIIGPPLINIVYQNNGPTPIWTTYVILMVLTTLLWIANYRRLLSK